MRTRAQWEEIEENILAPYAQKAAQSRGRKHPEPEHPYRSAYQRDRERIIHSRAFRRLEYKTQVFINHEGDHYRTRLTHTIEAATIARTIARTLRLNEDLSETIALAHDLGHPPFGHSGETALDAMMKNAGGFEHNRQSLRVVELLEKKYPSFAGLNLSWEVREGIVKHRTSYDPADDTHPDFKSSPSLEAQIVDKADEIAYNCHDLDDGLASNLLASEQLNQEELWKDSYENVRAAFSKTTDLEVLHYYTIRTLINTLVTDLVQTTEFNIAAHQIKSVADVRQCAGTLADFSADVSKRSHALRQFLYQNLYTHPTVARVNTSAIRIVKELFTHYHKNSDALKGTTKAKTAHTPLARVVCDYIAGMTDRFALEEHRRIKPRAAS